jgi:DNA-binding transcriptional LysR family regulator
MFMHPDGIKGAVIAGLGIAMVSKLTVKDDVRRKLLAIVSMKAGLPSRPIVVVDHRQKHHGAARCCKPSRPLSYGAVFDFAGDREAR